MLVVHKRTIFDLAGTLKKITFYWFLKVDRTDLLSEYIYIYIYALIFSLCTDTCQNYISLKVPHNS